MKGVSLYKTAELMGNSPEICRRHYACLSPESLVDCVEFDASSGSEVPMHFESGFGAAGVALAD